MTEFCCENRHCICGGLPEWELALLRSPKDQAILDLRDAVIKARRMGLEVKCEVKETIKTTI